MGYTTEFQGTLNFSRPATAEEKNYINLISRTRRMKRDVVKLMELYNGKGGNPFADGYTPEEIYGVDGEYFAVDDGLNGQKYDDSIVDYNVPPGQMSYVSIRKDERPALEMARIFNENRRRINDGDCQPSLWCQWVITEDGTGLEWNGYEKFYEYEHWLKYLIKHFFKKWDIKLNGEIFYYGEEPDDKGIISVKDNIVELKEIEIKRIFTPEDPYGEEDCNE